MNEGADLRNVVRALRIDALHSSGSFHLGARGFLGLGAFTPQHRQTFIELRQQLWEYVQSLNDRGVTVVLTTHYLEEAEELCDTIAIINHGQVVACEDKASLIGRIDCKELTLVLDRDLTAVPAGLSGLAGGAVVELAGPRRLVVRYRRQALRVEAILAAVQAGGIGLVDLSTKESDLEDVFLDLTRRPADRASAAGAA